MTKTLSLSLLLALPLTFLGPSAALADDGKLYISPYGDTNHAIRFLTTNDEEFTLIDVGSSPARQAIITKLTFTQFRNAVQHVLQITGDTLLVVSHDLLNQINVDLSKAEIALRFEDERLKETVPIGLMSFRNDERIAPLLILGKKHDLSASTAGIPAFPPGAASVDTVALTGTYGKFRRLDAIKYRFKIRSVEIAIEDGAMKDILVKGILEPGDISAFFQNVYPISISTPLHITNVNTRGNNLFRYHGDGREFYIDFADVIKYERIVAMGSGHYVPSDGVIRLTSENQEAITLVKNPFFDNFDVRIYTDVTGLQRDNPNGLIQTEGQYNILLNTKPLGPYTKLFRKILLFNRVAPFVAFSKIENKLNDLPLETVIRDSLSFNRTNSVDLLRYANLNVGVDMNLFTWIGSHTKFRINGLVGLYRTSVDSSSLSVVDNGVVVTKRFEARNVLSWFAMPLLSAQMIDGDKLDFDVSGGVIFVDLLDENISLSSPSPVYRYQMNLNIHPNPKHQDKSVFLRTTFFHTSRSHNNLSLQLGYATPISKFF